MASVGDADLGLRNDIMVILTIVVSLLEWLDYARILSCIGIILRGSMPLDPNHGTSGEYKHE